MDSRGFTGNGREFVCHQKALAFFTATRIVSLAYPRSVAISPVVHPSLDNSMISFRVPSLILCSCRLGVSRNCRISSSCRSVHSIVNSPCLRAPMKQSPLACPDSSTTSTHSALLNHPTALALEFDVSASHTATSLPRTRSRQVRGSQTAVDSPAATREPCRNPAKPRP